MSHPWHPQPTPPYQPYSPNTARVAKPRNQVAAIALIVTLLAGLAAALSVGLTVASHAWRSECIADSRLYGAGTVCAVIGVLLSVGAVVTGLIGVIGRDRARGAYLVMGIAAVVIGVVGGLVCLEMFREYITPHALPRHYQHQC